MTRLDYWPSPAKINLFLHVNGRRTDGYHDIQTYFQFIDVEDYLKFHIRNDGQISRLRKLENTSKESDLTVRAANLLKEAYGVSLGVDIDLKKNIPLGGGLGGGSSNAATVLVALNKLWRINTSKIELMELGRQLGADVPIFIFGLASFASGIGEVFDEAPSEEKTLLVLFPGVNVDTKAVFQNSQLTRDSATIKMSPKAIVEGRNDCEAVTRVLYPEVDEAMNWLSLHGRARMSGTGSSVFLIFESESEAQELVSSVPTKWIPKICKTANSSPLLRKLSLSSFR